MSRPANADMIEGFRDGYDPNAPEPSLNRSASYKHGFFVGRLDNSNEQSRYSTDYLERMAQRALDLDDLSHIEDV